MEKVNQKKEKGHLENTNLRDAQNAIDKEQKKIDKNHSRYCKKLRIKQPIDNPKTLGKIIGKRDYNKAETIWVSRARRTIYLGKKHNEKHWTIYDTKKQETLVARYFKLNTQLYEKIEKKVSGVVAKSSDVIDWILKVAGLITLLSGGG